MQVSNQKNSDSLSNIGTKEYPYSSLLSILNKKQYNENNLFLITDCLEEILRRDSNKSLMGCVGEYLSESIVSMILDYYINFKIDIPIINSIIICHGILGESYKKALKLCLKDSNLNHFSEIDELKRLIFEQFDNKETINLNLYIDILKIDDKRIISIYDFNENKFINGSFKDLLNRELLRSRSNSIEIEINSKEF